MKSKPIFFALSKAVLTSPPWFAISHPEKFESPKSERFAERGIIYRVCVCGLSLSLFFFFSADFCATFPQQEKEMEATCCNETLLLWAGGGITSRGKKKKTTRSRRGGVCFSRGLCARSSSSDDDDDDNNKAPLSSLNSAIELRSKLQEVALAARTRCVDSVRVHTRARAHRTFLFLRFLLSLSLCR